ncbi:MAG TPA: prolyl oligopeptidase family serine peptidase [Roseiflexaceae bacterium]|nr:prolyl oligopeptidase family serine peptidase [Roseiflexaceae bacterium]
MTPDQYLDALLALPMLDNAAISRDGKWAAWAWWKAAPTADVYIAPTDGSAPPTRLTDSDENTILVAWAPDGRSLLVRQDHGGDERSPIHFVSNIKGRLLIVQGLRDPNVTPQNVHVVADALQASNVEYQILAFEDEGHGIKRPKNQRTLYTRLAAFFGEVFEHR